MRTCPQRGERRCMREVRQAFANDACTNIHGFAGKYRPCGRLGAETLSRFADHLARFRAQVVAILEQRPSANAAAQKNLTCVPLNTDRVGVGSPSTATMPISYGEEKSC